MTTIIPAPYALQDCLLRLGTNDYQNQVSKAQLTPTTAQSTFKGLSPAARYPVSGGTDWVLEMTAAQDWETTNSLSLYMLSNAGQSVPFILEPINGGASFTGTVICAPGVIGGQQGSDATTQDYSLAASAVDYAAAE